MILTMSHYIWKTIAWWPVFTVLFTLIVFTGASAY